MKQLSFKTQLAIGVSTLMIAGSLSTASFAQEDGAAAQDVIISTGTRRKARSAADTPAPVDVITGADFAVNGSTDIGDMLRTAVPSYNVNTQPISDAATIIRPANLRGLSPDNTLVLLNGKRRHRGSVISFLGGGISDGAQGVDIGVFPTLAIKQIEILRDGASSQYGSDAIAGVMHFVLKDDREGGSVEARYGSTYEGDGDTFQIAGNIGLPLGEDGFVNITAEYGESDGTRRGVQRGDVAGLIAAGYTEAGDISVNTQTTDFAQYWGSPDVSGNLKLFINSGIQLSESVEAYAFGDYAERKVEGGFFYRNPTNRGGVYDGGRVGDETANGTGNCGQYTVLDNNGIPDRAVIAQLAADDNCFSFLELFPGGFVPRFGGDNTDFAITGGLKGELDMGNGLGYDVSGSLGTNESKFFIYNTINASLGSQSPTSFKPGAYKQEEVAFNLDLNYGIPISGWASDLGLAAGFEWRKETFDVTAGDPASFEIGPLARPSAAFPNGQGFSSGSNGFGGFSRNGSDSQTSIAAYAEAEGDITDNFIVQAAVRWTDYDNDLIGSSVDWKVGALYKITDNVRLRSTLSTGFHAPTAGQANIVNVTTAFNTQGFLADQATLPLTSSAGQFINSRLAKPFTLGPEKAQNLSIGTAFDLGGASFTIDYFNIKVEDRIAITDQQNFQGELLAFAAENNVVIAAGSTTSQIINTITAANVTLPDFTGFTDLTTAAFFANDFDTKTQGVDIVANMPLDLGGDRSAVTLAMNYTDTKVTNPGSISVRRTQALEESLPHWKGSLTFTHGMGMWSGLVRANYHSGWLDTNNGGNTDVNHEMNIDAEIGAQVMDNVKITIGAANLFDNVPDENPGQLGIGQLYPESAPFGFNGGSYYIKLLGTF